MTKLKTYNGVGSGVLNSTRTTSDGIYGLPALFNPSWLDEVFGGLEKSFNDAFAFPNSVYPYNITAAKNDDGDIANYQIQIALAGTQRENIYVGVKDNHLQIEVKKVENSDDKNVTYLRKGISHRNSTLTFDLTEKVDKKKITSSYKDGLLTVTVPIVQPETISIDVKVN